MGLKSLTEYIVRLMDENSIQVISQYENITVENNVFAQFMSACEQAQTPNSALLNTASLTKDSGIK